MGLFDRFKRQAKEAVDTNKITIQEGTPEADRIIQQREELLASIQKSKDEKKIIEKTDSKKTTKGKEKVGEKNKKPVKDDSSKKK